MFTELLLSFYIASECKRLGVDRHWLLANPSAAKAMKITAFNDFMCDGG